MGAANACFAIRGCAEGVLDIVSSKEQRRRRKEFNRFAASYRIDAFEPRTLTQLLNSSNPEDRAFALQTIGQAGREGARHVNTVVCMLEDPAWLVCDAAAQALCSLGGSVAVSCADALRRLSQRPDGDAAMRLAAAGVLEHFTSAGLLRPLAVEIPRVQGVLSETQLEGTGRIVENRELALAAVRRAGGSLRYCSQELKRDRTVVAAALQQSQGEALRYAATELRGDPEVVGLALAAAAATGSRAGSMAAEAAENPEARTGVLQYASEDIREQETIEEELESYSELLLHWRRLEKAVFASTQTPTTEYLSRRAGFVRLMRELDGELNPRAGGCSGSAWAKALVALDAFYTTRGRAQVREDYAIAALMMVVRSEQRRFSYEDAEKQLAAHLDIASLTKPAMQALQDLEFIIFSTLRGRVLLPSVPCWAAAILSRIELRAGSRTLRAQLHGLRQALAETAELIAGRVPTSDALPPRALACGACAAVLANCGLLPREDWSENSRSCSSAVSPSPPCPAFAVEDAPSEDAPCGSRDSWEQEISLEALLAPDSTVSELDMDVLAWAAGCTVDTLRADVRATLHSAAPVIAPAA